MDDDIDLGAVLGIMAELGMKVVIFDDEVIQTGGEPVILATPQNDNEEDNP